MRRGKPPCRECGRRAATAHIYYLAKAVERHTVRKYMSDILQMTHCAEKGKRFFFVMERRAVCCRAGNISKDTRASADGTGPASGLRSAIKISLPVNNKCAGCARITYCWRRALILCDIEYTHCCATATDVVHISNIPYLAICDIVSPLPGLAFATSTVLPRARFCDIDHFSPGLAFATSFVRR